MRLAKSNILTFQKKPLHFPFLVFGGFFKALLGHTLIGGIRGFGLPLAFLLLPQFREPDKALHLARVQRAVRSGAQVEQEAAPQTLHGAAQRQQLPRALVVGGLLLLVSAPAEAHGVDVFPGHLRGHWREGAVLVHAVVGVLQIVRVLKRDAEAIVHQGPGHALVDLGTRGPNEVDGEIRAAHPMPVEPPNSGLVAQQLRNLGLDNCCQVIFRARMRKIKPRVIDPESQPVLES